MWNYGLPRLDYHDGFLIKGYNDFRFLAEYKYNSDSWSNRAPGKYNLDIKPFKEYENIYARNLEVVLQPFLITIKKVIIQFKMKI